ncbi:hypothetical protein FLP41_14820 [Paracoccus marcusii]|uniref:hypothetical protein n=1 Tax=Paracoccus marcusii TaxID=59779 RepID=UPI002ED3F2AB|nr:hypothetical protein FLP41_14820 [Paracoccus marcusii]
MDRILRRLSTALLIGACALVPQDGIAQQRPTVGEVPAPEQVRQIDKPGAVGAWTAAAGQRLCRRIGHLVRIQIGSGKILSILRPLPD